MVCFLWFLCSPTMDVHFVCFLFPTVGIFSTQNKNNIIWKIWNHLLCFMSAPFSSNTLASDTILIEHDYFVFIVLMFCKRLFRCQYLSWCTRFSILINNPNHSSLLLPVSDLKTAREIPTSTNSMSIRYDIYFPPLSYWIDKDNFFCFFKRLMAYFKEIFLHKKTKRNQKWPIGREDRKSTKCFGSITFDQSRSFIKTHCFW